MHNRDDESRDAPSAMSGVFAKVASFRTAPMRWKIRAILFFFVGMCLFLQTIAWLGQTQPRNFKDEGEVLALELTNAQNTTTTMRETTAHNVTLFFTKPTRYIDGLEFVHITKTAGSSIEATAAKFGIKYGACHWKKILSFGGNCTKPDKSLSASAMKYNHTRIPFRFEGIFGEPWHTPHHWFLKNPYPSKATFCVVRNPYERLVSEYHCKWGGYDGDDKANATIMNEYIQRMARKSIRDHRGAHWLPQHMYVYDVEGNQVIDHILRFEHLNEDFSALMKLYNLAIELPEKKNARNTTGTTSALTVANLTKDTIKVINWVYKEDFKRFHYQKVR